MKRGTIRRRTARSFELKFDVPSPDGSRRTRYVRFRGTHAQAERELTKLISQADAGTLPDPGAQTVSEYVRTWLEGARAAPSTIERYRQLYANQITPHLGGVKLSRLKPEHISTWHAAMMNDGLSPRTARNAHALLSTVLADAVKFGTIAKNPASTYGPPKVEDQELEILTPDQLGDVLTKLEGTSLYVPVMLAAYTGVRRGELLGLQYGDLDFDAAQLSVARSVEETSAGLRLKTPKTKHSKRTLSLPANVVEALRVHKLGQLEMRLALGQGPIKRDTLIFSTIEGELIRPRNLSKAWWRARRALDLPPVSFHAFRHSHASMLIRQGVDIFTVSRRLGHSKPATTLNVYAHAMPGHDAAVTQALEAITKRKT